MNSTIKKLIYEDSDFAEPQTLQDYGPVISSAKDLAFYLLYRGFRKYYFIKNYYNLLSICVKYSTEIKIEQKHTEYPDLKGYEIGIYTENLRVSIRELSNNETEIHILVSIHLPHRRRNNPAIYSCFYKQIPNTKLQDFAYMMEEALTHFEDAQKYIDSGKGLLALVYDIRDVFKPLEGDKT